jgi:hypothetical protein
MGAIKIPVPDLQIDFSFALERMRGLYLQEALSATIDKLDITKLDKELGKYVPKASLKALAVGGLRGELVFVVPCVLEANPFLLGYYRLLLGFSQKEFYSAQFGLSRFKSMETKGTLSDLSRELIPELCRGLIDSATFLVEGLGAQRLSRELLRDLTLLTVGPQLRGGANVKKGFRGIVDAFNAIKYIVDHSIVKSNEYEIEIRNAAKRKVTIQFAADPDIIIREEMSDTNFRNIIAIEVKGGTDFSNIHNRLGEAEKSHQKARLAGFTECWTIVNVDNINLALAKKESPSTDRFYLISSLKSRTGEEYKDFKNRIISLAGIRNR